MATTLTDMWYYYAQNLYYSMEWLSIVQIEIGFVKFLIFILVKTCSENFKWYVIKTLIYSRNHSKNLVVKFPLQVT